jgi:hypothetical protein
MNTYKASMDTLTKGLTIGLSILLVSFGFIPILNRPSLLFTTNEFRFSELIYPESISVIAFAIIIMLVVTYGFSPKGYVLEDGEFTVLRPFKAKNFSLSDILSVTSVEKKNLKGSIRTFGVGGLFGYFGLFRNSTYGNMVWYATRRDRFVVIERSNGKTIVITPDDPAAFVSAYQSIVGK